MYKLLPEIHFQKHHLGLNRRSEDNIKTDLKETLCEAAK
jgi:hypothetical protein